MPPDATLIPLAVIYGPATPAQERVQARRDLLDSAVAVAIAAYRALGYQVPMAAVGPRLPYRTRIAVGDGGPSAGLMMALALYSRLAPGDLAMATRSPAPAPSTRAAAAVPSVASASR